MSLLWVTARRVWVAHVDHLHHYDVPAGEPNAEGDWEGDPGGDDGWQTADLVPSIREHGIRQPLEVGRSRYQMSQGDHRVYVFNGNHRLRAARRAGLTHVPVTYPSPAVEDAEPLADHEYEALRHSSEGAMSLLWVGAARGHHPIGYCPKCDGPCQVSRGVPTLYHGTDAELAPGERLVPGRERESVVEDMGDDTHDSVWMTPDPDEAHHWAEQAAARHGGEPHVYEVHHPSPEKNGEDWIAPHATVVRRVR